MGKVDHKELLRFLASEKDFLLSGNIAEIINRTEEKVNLFQDLKDYQTPDKILHSISMRLVQNQKLIAAAIRGIQNARSRLNELENVRAGLTVYDKNGHLNNASSGKTCIERKA